MFGKQEIKKRINELARQISSDYQANKNGLVLVGLLRGCFVFIADLCRKLTVSHQIDFMTVSSYGNNIISSGKVKISKDLDTDIYQKDVLVIEDIVDSGYTLNQVSGILKKRQPNSVAICTLLDKPSCRKVETVVNYVGFKISDEFVVGYGIDCAQCYRHLPYLGKIVNEKLTETK